MQIEDRGEKDILSKRLDIRLLDSVSFIAENYGCKITYKISLVMGKPVFGVSDKERCTPVFLVTETS